MLNSSLLAEQKKNNPSEKQKQSVFSQTFKEHVNLYKSIRCSILELKMFRNFKNGFYILCLLFVVLVTKCSGGYILTTRDATKFLFDWKRDFDMNFGFQLRKMGIVQNNRRGSKTYTQTRL